MSADEVRIINSYEYDAALDSAYRIEYGLRDTSYANLKTLSATEVNLALGYSNPPYRADSPAAQFSLSNSKQYVRVYTDQGRGIEYGKWIMRAEDIQGLTPAQIRDKFALPSLPTHICDVNVPAGTQLHTGIAGPINGWGNGGGLQYDIINQYDTSWFVNGRPLS